VAFPHVIALGGAGARGGLIASSHLAVGNANDASAPEGLILGRHHVNAEVS